MLTLEYEVQEEDPTMDHKQSEYLHNLDTGIVAGSTKKYHFFRDCKSESQ